MKGGIQKRKNILNGSAAAFMYLPKLKTSLSISRDEGSITSGPTPVKMTNTDTVPKVINVCMFWQNGGTLFGYNTA